MMRMFRRRKGMSCDQVMEVLQSYLDGETDTETARNVASHLDVCDDCGPESSVYVNIKKSLAAQREDVDPEILETLRNFTDRMVRGEID